MEPEKNKKTVSFNKKAFLKWIIGGALYGFLSFLILIVTGYRYIIFWQNPVVQWFITYLTPTGLMMMLLGFIGSSYETPVVISLLLASVIGAIAGAIVYAIYALIRALIFKKHSDEPQQD